MLFKFVCRGGTTFSISENKNLSVLLHIPGSQINAMGLPFFELASVIFIPQCYVHVNINDRRGIMNK